MMERRSVPLERPVPICITWSSSGDRYLCEGNAKGVFAATTGTTSYRALQNWRKATNYWGEVKA